MGASLRIGKRCATKRRDPRTRSASAQRSLVSGSCCCRGTSACWPPKPPPPPPPPLPRPPPRPPRPAPFPPAPFAPVALFVLFVRGAPAGVAEGALASAAVALVAAPRPPFAATCPGGVGARSAPRTRNPRLSTGSAAQPVTPGKLKLGRLGYVNRSSFTGVAK